jgi:hypothetical protein
MNYAASEEEIEEAEDMLRKPRVGSPNINDRSKHIKREKPIHDHLMDSGKKYDDNRERRRTEQMAEFVSKNYRLAHIIAREFYKPFF